jgi:translation initiation factor 5B
MATRQPIITILGHVDHGKTTLADKIRGSAVAKHEAGAITQHIGATEIPISAIKHISGKLLEKMNIKLTIPGILIIDTPGHEAFTNLRKRGGSIADLAIVVVDINEGFKAQTREIVAMLKQLKVPFVLAANKIDLIPGWIPRQNSPFLESLDEQTDVVKEDVDEKIYKLVISLADFNINSERFDRVDDYTKQVAVIPTSGITGEGIPELLMVISGLAQKYLENKLQIKEGSPAKGTVLEVKDEKGLGKTIDVIIYDGELKQGDTIVVAGIDEPIVTKVRALLKPAPLKELKEKGQFQPIKSVSAAAGVKISAPGLDNAVAGMSLQAASSDEEIEHIKKAMSEEVKQIIISAEHEGVIIKADTIGALEAMIDIFRKINVPIKRANIGDINKNDIVEAHRMGEKNPVLGVILAFNVAISKEIAAFADEHKVKIFSSDVIYTIHESYARWKAQTEEEMRRKELETITTPAKIRLLPSYIFRQSNPAVIGIEIIAGKIKAGERLIKQNGEKICEIKEIQKEKESVSEASAGESVAISLPGITIGRNLKGNETLYSEITIKDFHKIKGGLKKYLSGQEIDVLKEIIEIKRKEEPLWGV